MRSVFRRRCQNERRIIDVLFFFFLNYYFGLLIILFIYCFSSSLLFVMLCFLLKYIYTLKYTSIVCCGCCRCTSQNIVCSRTSKQWFAEFVRVSATTNVLWGWQPWSVSTSGSALRPDNKKGRRLWTAGMLERKRTKAHASNTHQTNKFIIFI